MDAGVEVSLLTGHPDDWQRQVAVTDREGKSFTGVFSGISSDPAEVVGTADIVLLCLPGYLIEECLVRIRPFLRKGSIVGCVVGSTGFFFAAHKVLDSATGLFAFQRVPYIARQSQYGRKGELLGYKKELNVAVENIPDKEGTVALLRRLFRTPVRLLDSYYEVSLSNSNPILHTGRLYSMWKDYQGETFERNPKFYADWTDEASDILLAMDAEFMQLLESLGIDKGVIPSLLDYYEVRDAKTLTDKIKSIPAFRSIASPMKETEKGWVPDFGSRYFTEDFPFGLKFIHDLAREKGLHTPTIDTVYSWGMRMVSGSYGQGI